MIELEHDPFLLRIINISLLRTRGILFAGTYFPSQGTGE
ncbi:hypothetical protein PM8797T_00619 [Gimesia maris DSM 8797]|nr:hypothetical protein PM8797T_00619 [Gimesia maris DSM 8797]